MLNISSEGIPQRDRLRLDSTNRADVTGEKGEGKERGEGPGGGRKLYH